jgi:hypothetical protein
MTPTVLKNTCERREY